MASSAHAKGTTMARSIDEARAAIRDVLARSGLSMRALSAAMGRDADYVAAFLDPRRSTRARPSPEDLLAASDATGIAVVELLDAVWGIPPARLADELGTASGGSRARAVARLTPGERGEVADFARFLAGRNETPTPAASTGTHRRRRREAAAEDDA
jgi:transcriptional regulator with XRE-family HTH domain